MVGNGACSPVLALFLAELQYPDSQIGIFMTLTLLGDVLLGTYLTLVADRIGRRRILLAGSLLMIFTGVVFAVFQNFWILLVAAIFGVVSATGGDFGPFRAIEESIISQLTIPATRPEVLAWYVTLSTLGASAGGEAAGRLVEYWSNMDGWSLADAYHAIFWTYTITGVLNAGFFLLLTEDCEASNDPNQSYTQVAQEDSEGIEMDGNPTDVNPSRSPIEVPSSTSKFRTWLGSLGQSTSAISRPTLSVMIKLWALLAFDSLADGMVPYALTMYYLDNKFHPSKATLGDITSIGFFLASISGVFAGPLARRIGLINTMVFTHIPSSSAVLLFPLPNVLWLTIVLFFIRMGLNNMDQAPRAAFIAGVVKPSERTAIMGITTMVRTLAAMAGPASTGFLAGSGRFWVAFAVAGSSRLAYDIGLYVLFVNVPLNQHEKVHSESEMNGTRPSSADDEAHALTPPSD